MTVQSDPAMERARKRAKELKEFYSHAFTYVAVCALLVVIDLVDGSAGDTFLGLNWAYWPILGWGVAVVIHGATTGFAMSDWEDRKVAELYAKEHERDLQSQ